MDCCQLADYWLRKPGLNDLPKPQRASVCERDLALHFPSIRPELRARVALKQMLLGPAHVLQTRVGFIHERVAYDLKMPQPA